MLEFVDEEYSEIEELNLKEEILKESIETLGENVRNIEGDLKLPDLEDCSKDTFPILNEEELDMNTFMNNFDQIKSEETSKISNLKIKINLIILSECA